MTVAPIGRHLIFPKLNAMPVAWDKRDAVSRLNDPGSSV
jgi:hypothetical protein